MAIATAFSGPPLTSRNEGNRAQEEHQSDEGFEWVDVEGVDIGRFQTRGGGVRGRGVEPCHEKENDA